MERWIDFLLNQVLSLAVLSGIGYFFRDRLNAWIDAKTKHRFDAEIERLKAELSDRSREIEALRNAPLEARAARQVNLDKRKLEAVDQLWGAVKDLYGFKSTLATIALIKWDAAAAEAKKSEQFREAMKLIGNVNFASVVKYSAHSARLYITPLAWSLFTAYSITLGFAAMRLKILQTGVGASAMKGPEELEALLIVTLPDWSERIKRFGPMCYPSLVEELEMRLLGELRRSLEGVDDDAAELERAASIMKAAQKFTDPKSELTEEKLRQTGVLQ